MHKLPIGALVVYQADNGNKALLTIVEHSYDCDGSHLYMAAERPIAPPPSEYKVYSRPYLIYRLHAGWFVGNVHSSAFVDTGDRVEVKPFEIEGWMQ